MKIRSIFTKKGDGRLWGVGCPSSKKEAKQSDVFTELMNQFNDTQHLASFFNSHLNELNNPFWRSITVDQAIDKVIEEINNLEVELYSIELKLPDYENRSLSDVFLPLHDNVYSISFSKESYRKAKPDFIMPMVRIYALELEDGTMIITGGAIKLTKDMPGDIFDSEKSKLDKLRDFLKAENIIDIEGLKELGYE